jgi:acetyl-CoA carboxylase carboxyl transferase subunit beta
MDPDSFVETDAGMTSGDPLKFKDIRTYPEQIARYRAKTGLREAVVTGHGKIHGIEVSIGFMDPNFIMGSVGSVVGEKVARVFDYSIEHKAPAVMFCATGGMRMQEGLISLMQMAKTSGAVGRLHDAGVPYIPVLTDPTGAGVAASFGMLGDLIIAEPGAEIYFTGSRVIEKTIRQALPKGFQRSEFMLQHGLIDMIVTRRDMKNTLADTLSMLSRQRVTKVSPAPPPSDARSAA